MYPYFDFASLLIYVAVALFATISINLSLNYKKSTIYPKQFGYFLFFILFVSLASLRLVTVDIVGTDSYMYERLFLNCLSSSDRFEEKDILFGYFNKIIRTFCSSPIIYRTICYSIITLSYIAFIKTFCKKGITCIPFVLLMIPFLKSLNTMRNSMAIAVILFGIILLKNKREIWGVILILISLLIHRMSVLYVLFIPFYYFVRNLRYKESDIKLIILVSVLTFGGYYLAVQVQKYVIALALLDANDIYYISENLNSSIFESAVTIIPLILLSVMWLISNKKLPTNQDIDMLKLMFSFDVVIAPIAFILGMWRANEYFYIGRLVFWSYLITAFCSNFNKISRLLIKTIFLILFTSWLVYRILREWEPCGLMPYKIFF